MFGRKPPHDEWYGTARWKKRRRAQLLREPLCAMCLAKALVVPAEVADHVIPHRGDPKLFWFGKLQSLCANHHNSAKKEMETRGYASDIGIDGYPIDPMHPANRV